MNFERDKDFLLSLIAILAIVILESIALFQGKNGIALTTSIAAISGAGGIGLGQMVGKKKRELDQLRQQVSGRVELNGR